MSGLPRFVIAQEARGLIIDWDKESQADRDQKVTARVSTPTRANGSESALDAKVKERLATIIATAVARAKSRMQEHSPERPDQAESSAPGESELNIVEHAYEIISEAERTAQEIVVEAKKRAEAITDLVQMKAFESTTGDEASIWQEPKAPGLVGELRRRFGQVEFGEPSVQQSAPSTGQGGESSIRSFPVLAGATKEKIGQYSVQVSSGKIAGKRYEHMGRLLIVRGRIADHEYQSLQRFAENGQMEEIRRQLARLGMRNHAVYDFPAFIWDARAGRQDRYSHEVQFP
jgi:hypothetical protein